MKEWHKLNLSLRDIPETILFNFRYLPLKQAIKFPIVISHRDALQTMSGEYND